MFCDKSWDDMQQMLEDGEIDMVTSARKTPDREEKLDVYKRQEEEPRQLLVGSINIWGLHRCQSPVLPIGTWCMDFMERKRLRMKKVCRLCGILHET